MYEYHSAFRKPIDENVKLWRYMDFTKFVSILNTSSLFFTRVDMFKDKYEGIYSRYNRDNAYRMYDDLEPSVVENLIQGQEHMIKLLRENTVVSCWHMNDFESSAMWDLYLKSSEGIAIQTTFNRLSNSFGKAEETIHIGEIDYIDYESEWMPEGNLFFPFLHKRKSFEHEKEVRAIFSVFPDGINYPDFSKGKTISVDLDELVENVYVSPESPEWFASLVEDVLERFNFNKRVIHSNLYNLPK